MSLYWGFQLEAVARRNLYLDRIRETETYQDLQAAILRFRAELAETKPWISLPM